MVGRRPNLRVGPVLFLWRDRAGRVGVVLHVAFVGVLPLQDVGILARPERVVIIVAGLLLESIGIRIGPWSPLTVALLILAIGTNFTAVQRVWVVWQQNRAELRATRGHVAQSTGAEQPVEAQPVRAAMRRFFENLGKT